MLAIQRIDARRADPWLEIDRLRSRLGPQGDVVSEASRQRTIEVFGQPLTPRQVVQTICERVRREGLAAVVEYTRKLDGVELDAESLRVGRDELERAHRQADPQFLATVRRIRERIERFQSAIRHRDCQLPVEEGVELGQRYRPLWRIGICVPGGAAAYPSTVLMTAVPAQVAGVPEIAVVAPPTPYGAGNADLLATCQELGLGEVYRVGGAQGVAALAYGLSCLPPVDKIVGPGNLFVALAKQHVFGTVGIDAIAGPSEVVVIADRTTPPAFVAADLLAQAEHAPGASVLITWSGELLDEVARELDRQVAGIGRSSQAVHSLEHFGALIQVADDRQACEVADRIAPEHLHIATEDASRLADQIRHAGAIFLGPYSPVALGDYVAGPSHVLPTSGTARWASGLSANDFLRSSSTIRYSPAALRRAAPDLARMADMERLDAHRASVDIRLQENRPGEEP